MVLRLQDLVWHVEEGWLMQVVGLPNSSLPESPLFDKLYGFRRHTCLCARVIIDLKARERRDAIDVNRFLGPIPQ